MTRSFDTGFNRGYLSMLVPALRYFVCNGCGTVYADLEPPAACHRCDGTRIEELPSENQAFDYFTGR